MNGILTDGLSLGVGGVYEGIVWPIISPSQIPVLTPTAHVFAPIAPVPAPNAPFF